MQGLAEVAFAAELFSRVEKMLGLPDRTGDEMHSAMHTGPMIRKGDRTRSYTSS